MINTITLNVYAKINIGSNGNNVGEKNFKEELNLKKKENVIK